MPYIEKERRLKLDQQIDQVCIALSNQEKDFSNSPEDLLKISGDINYCLSRICAQLISNPSYGKIVVITGVLENVKQELYRRLASSYEDQKIESNGDIPEYKKYNI